jgi:hypothetical protein
LKDNLRDCHPTRSSMRHPPGSGLGVISVDFGMSATGLLAPQLRTSRAARQSHAPCVGIESYEIRTYLKVREGLRMGQNFEATRDDCP